MVEEPFPARQAIVTQQLGQLRHLLQAVVPSNRFYTNKFRNVAALSDVATSAEGAACAISFPIRTLADLARLPFTAKSELVADQQEHPPFGTNLTFGIDRYTRYHQTSGTKGTPLRWLDTPQSWDWMIERWLEIFQAAAVTKADRIVFAFSFGPFIGFWLAFEAGTRLGAICLPAGGLSSHARVRMILDTGATVLCCTPTYALHLAETAQAEKIDLSAGRLRRIIVAGEAGGSIPATRARLESLWLGARVFDHHGMTETGPVTYECPAQPGLLHVMETGFIAELIEPATGQLLEPGQAGELVLTSLGRIGSPLIRYRTGDLVKIASKPCPCGRHKLALEGGILGRVDDMVIVRGVNVYPTAVEEVLRACGNIAEYQVKVTRSGALTELVVVVEPDSACQDPAALVARVQKNFHNAFALRVPVELAPAGSLPRFEMKAKRWRTE